MVCSLAEGVVIEFEATGVKIQPYELSTRSEKGQHDYVRAVISRKAGELIAAKSETGEPVNVYIDGAVQGRYVLPQNSLSMSGDGTSLELYDGSIILESGAVNGAFNEARLVELVEFVFETIQDNDPYSIVKGWKMLDSEEAFLAYKSAEQQAVEYLYQSEDISAEEVEETVVVQADGTFAFPTGVVNIPGMLAVLDSLWSALPFVRDSQGTLEFVDNTPKEALEIIGQAFGVDFWLDEEGYLWIGLQLLRDTNDIGISTSARDENYRISSYSVSRGDTPVFAVAIRGATRWYPDRDSNNPQHDGAHLYPQAAVFSGVSGNASADPTPLNLQSLQAVEHAAQMKFINKWMDYESGNIVFNSMASESKDKLAQLRVGSLIYVDGNFGRSCGRYAEGGLFVVTRVQHSLSRRQGWVTTVTVSGLPEDMRTVSNLVDPQSGSTYIDWEDFSQQT